MASPRLSPRCVVAFSLSPDTRLEEFPPGVKHNLISGLESVAQEASRAPLAWDGPLGVQWDLEPALLVAFSFEMDHRKVVIAIESPEHGFYRYPLRPLARRLAVNEGRRFWAGGLLRFFSALGLLDRRQFFRERSRAYRAGLLELLQSMLATEMARRIHGLMYRQGWEGQASLEEALACLKKSIPASQA